MIYRRYWATLCVHVLLWITFKYVCKAQELQEKKKKGLYFSLTCGNPSRIKEKTKKPSLQKKRNCNNYKVPGGIKFGVLSPG